MISAYLALLIGNKNKKFHPNVYGFTAPGKFNEYRLSAVSVPAYASQIVSICSEIEKATTVRALTLSASGIGKYEVVKNDVVIATLFPDRDSHVTYYKNDILLKKGDSLSIICTNTERCNSQDMYVGFDVK